MKRIITLILATLVLLTSLSFAVFAESDAMEELNLFGIVPDSITAGNLQYICQGMSGREKRSTFR